MTEPAENPTPSPSPGAENSEARLSMKMAKIAAATALVTALLSAGAGYWTGHQQAQSQTQQSQTDYLRSKRQEAYSKLLGAVSALRYYNLTDIADHEASVTRDDVTLRAKPWYDHMDAVLAASADVRLIGSEGAAAAQAKLVDAAGAYVFSETLLAIMKKPSDEFDSASTSGQKYRDSLDAAINEFVNAAQHDLGSTI